MKEAEEQPSATWWKAPARQWTLLLRDREEHVFLILTLLIGALVGMTVVAFILLTERFGARLYPTGGAAWRRLLVPVVGSLGIVCPWGIDTVQPECTTTTCSVARGITIARLNVIEPIVFRQDRLNRPQVYGHR